MEVMNGRALYLEKSAPRQGARWQRLERERHRELVRINGELARHQVNKTLVTIRSTNAMLADQRLGAQAAECLFIAMQCALDNADYAQCYQCRQPWRLARPVALVGAAEFIGTEEVIFFAICRQCAGDRDAVMKTLRADFGELTFVGAAGQA
jgi:hypothetical protein